MSEGLLSTLRVLDLTDDNGWFCGRILADMGAEVVKVEPPGGDPSRNKGPFFGNMPHPERSLYWFAYNAGKKGITLNLGCQAGSNLLRKLSDKADFLIESFRPGHMESIGLGYEDLSSTNPGLIYTSITPFGQTGPWRDFKASDLTLQALAGIAFNIGEPEREPLKMCLEQSFLLAGSHGAIGSLIALHHRRRTGTGQLVDVSIHDCLVRLNYRDPVRWDIDKSYSRRQGNHWLRLKVKTRVIWQCKDGYVTWLFVGGPPGARENVPLTDWIASEGVLGSEELQRTKWDEVDFTRTSQDQIDRWEKVFGLFFASHTKQELWQGALRRRLTVVPVLNVEEAYRYEQPRARGFWHRVNHHHLGASLDYPGHLFLSNATQAQVRGPAPLIGEHNAEICETWLGLSRERLDSLKAQGVI